MRSPKSVAVPAGKMQIEGRIRRRCHAQHAGIQRHQLIHRRAHNVRDQAQIDGIVDGHRIGEHRRIERYIVKAILRGMIGDDDRRQDFRHIVLGFRGQVVALVELPEIGVARLLHRALHIARAPVVAGHRQIPVAQLVVDELHVAGIGAGRFFRIEALVHIRVARQPVVAMGHELPHAAGAGAGGLSARGLKPDSATAR